MARDLMNIAKTRSHETNKYITKEITKDITNELNR